MTNWRATVFSVELVLKKIRYAWHAGRATPIVFLAVPAARINGVRKVVLNELLAYANCYRHGCNDDAMQRVVLTHFSHEDIAEAKRLLVQEFQAVPGAAQFATERRNSSARPAHEAEVEDIIGFLDVADVKKALDGYVFVAENLQKMPKYGPEEINLCTVVDRQVNMETAIKDLSASVQKMSVVPSAAAAPAVVQQAITSVSHDLQQQLGTFNDAVGAWLDHLIAVCAQLAENVAARHDPVAARNDVTAAPRAGRQPRDRDVDRSQNLIIFGVAEDRDACAWRRRAENALEFVAGAAVDVADMLRIGRYAENKTRPILVKLRTAWDRRIILAKCSRLKDYSERNIFINADEPVEERRRKTLERFKSRAEQQGKSVPVTNGILYVDGVAVFSIKDGKINNNGRQ